MQAGIDVAAAASRMARVRTAGASGPRQTPDGRCVVANNPPASHRLCRCDAKGLCRYRAPKATVEGRFSSNPAKLERRIQVERTASPVRVRWYCGYRIVIVPKYPKKAIFEVLQREIGGVLKNLCGRLASSWWRGRRRPVMCTCAWDRPDRVPDGDSVCHPIESLRSMGYSRPILDLGLTGQARREIGFGQPCV